MKLSDLQGYFWMDPSLQLDPLKTRYLVEMIGAMILEDPTVLETLTSAGKLYQPFINSSWSPPSKL